MRVFVSSTFKDLAEFREQVGHALRQLGVIDIGMEHFGARDAYPLDECIRLIKEEADLFVGIYAHRYGFVPKGNDISITEAEYRAAGELTRSIYLVDEDTPWKPRDIDRGADYKALKRFKDELRAAHIVKVFSSPHQLASFVAADVGRELLARMLPDPKRNERRREILEKARFVSGALGNKDTYLEAALGGRIEVFWQLYYGDLIGVENGEVEAAMVRLGELLNQWKASPTMKPEGFDDRVLELSAALGRQLGEES